MRQKDNKSWNGIRREKEKGEIEIEIEIFYLLYYFYCLICFN